MENGRMEKNGRMENGEGRGGRAVVRYEVGERFEFGLTLYAQALQLFPYLVLATKEFELGGIGLTIRRDDGRWRRGTLAIEQVWAENPLTGERQAVMQAEDRMVRVPDVPITHGQVCKCASLQVASLQVCDVRGGE